MRTILTTGYIMKALAYACLAVGLAIGAAPLRADPAELPIAVDRSEAIALVRSTLVRLNDANLTADYVILRATSAPDFQAHFSEQALAGLFAKMRAYRIDLSRVVALEPVIDNVRFHAGQNVLQLEGSIVTGPVRIQFGFAYQSFNGVWKLYGLNLDFKPAPKPRGISSAT